MNLDFEINLILLFQQLGTWLVSPMKFFTFLGYEEFYLLIAPALYWCFNTGLGLRFGLYLITSAGLNTTFKFLFHAPRPYWIDLRVHAFTAEGSFGIPSGHAQNAIPVWGCLATNFRKAWVWALAIALMILIGLSRIYLGVHFPRDVLAGWLIGGALLWLMLTLEKPALDWLHQRSFGVQVASLLAVSLLLIAIGAGARLSLAGWTLPTEWSDNARIAFPDAEPINPLDFSPVVSNGGVFFGLALGGLLIFRRGGFDPAGPPWKRLLRYMFGLIGVLIFWMGLGMVFPRGETWMPLTLRFVRYFLTGLWVTYLAPLAFIATRLAGRR